MKQGVESHLIPCNGQVDRKALKAIRELAAQTEADVVHAHGYKADIYAYLALRSTVVPLISTCHNWLDNDRKDLVYGVIDRFFLRRFAGIVAVSEEVRRRLLNASVPAEKIKLIKNGIDLRPFGDALPAVRNELGWGDYQLVGLVGRLSIEKGVDIFLRAAAGVLKHLPNTKFAVAGDGPENFPEARCLDRGTRNRCKCSDPWPS